MVICVLRGSSAYLALAMVQLKRHVRGSPKMTSSSKKVLTRKRKRRRQNISTEQLNKCPHTDPEKIFLKFKFNFKFHGEIEKLPIFLKLILDISFEYFRSPRCCSYCSPALFLLMMIYMPSPAFPAYDNDVLPC